MPILIREDSASDLLGLAEMAGQAQGTARRLDTQRRIDAETIHNAQAAATARNALPGFFDRAAAGADLGPQPKQGVQSFRDSGRLGTPAEAVNRARMDIDEDLRRFRDVSSDASPYAKLAGELELRKTGRLSPGTLSMLGVETSRDESARIAAEAAETRANRPAGRGGSAGTRNAGSSAERATSGIIGAGRIDALVPILQERQRSDPKSYDSPMVPTDRALQAMKQVYEALADENTPTSVIRKIADGVGPMAESDPQLVADAKGALQRREIQNDAVISTHIEPVIEQFHQNLPVLAQQHGWTPAQQRAAEEQQILQLLQKYGLEWDDFESWVNTQQAVQAVQMGPQPVPNAQPQPSQPNQPGQVPREKRLQAVPNPNPPGARRPGEY